MNAGHSRQGGIALVIVLWITMLLAIMAGSFAYSMRTETALTTHALERSQARALAEAGIAYAAMKVLLNPDIENPWPVEGSMREWAFGRGVVRLSVVDAGGKIDINHANRNLLVSLLASTGLEEEQAQALADVIEDWRDPDDARRINGAEEDEYLAAGYPVGPKNALFESVEELQQVLGITPEIYQQLVDLVTVYSNQPGINPAAASLAVLSVVPDVDVQLMAEYVQLRSDSIELGEPLPPPPELGPYLSAGKGLAYYVSLESELETGAKIAVKAVIMQGQYVDQAYRTAVWREGFHAQPPPSSPSVSE